MYNGHADSHGHGYDIFIFTILREVTITSALCGACAGMLDERGLGLVVHLSL
jgi:hypothetical protein